MKTLLVSRIGEISALWKRNPLYLEKSAAQTICWNFDIRHSTYNFSWRMRSRKKRTPFLSSNTRAIKPHLGLEFLTFRYLLWFLFNTSLFLDFK